MQTGSIQSKLRLAVLLVGSLALIGISTGFLLYQARASQSTTERELTMLASIVGERSAIVLQSNDNTLLQTELASLRFNQAILSACIYDLSGKVLARYAQSASASAQACPSVKPPGCEIRTGVMACSFAMQAAVESHALRESHGTVYIEAAVATIEDAQQNAILITLAALLVVVIVVSVAFERFVQADFVKPIEQLVRGAQAIASGDLTTKVRLTRSDEIGVLAHAFNEMGRGLDGLISQVRSTLGSVSTVVLNLHKASTQMSDEVRRQEQSVEETSDSIERLGASIGEVSRNAERLAASATETSSSMLEMNTSINTVAGHMDDLAEAIEAASSSVIEMGTSIQQIGESVDTLEGATHTTEASVLQLNSAVVQVTANAKRGQDLSRQTSERAQRGMEAVAEMIRAMDLIQSSFARLEATIASLEQRSEAIGSVIRVIDEVVDQTKLLSLNASIIASQAGEHGKAFAVVADEVKNLSDRTAQSTREITQLVQNVQHETAQAVQLMGQGATTVSHGVALSKDAGDALESILECSHLSLQMVNEIVKSTATQNTDIVSLDRSVDTVKQIVEQVRRAMHEQRSVSGEIMRLVESVRHLGIEVKRATQEQSIESTLIAKAMEAVMQIIREIVQETKVQAQGNERLQSALDVFRAMTVENGRISTEMLVTVDLLSLHARAVTAEIDKLRVAADVNTEKIR